MQWCNKHVIIYSGARVSELIRAIRSFISIDYEVEIKNVAYECVKQLLLILKSAAVLYGFFY